ncbi:polysaccharide pyruvyl transferase family protein [Rivibacter subsaxonicus]|uniref:Polysaccharide pyruvyl transferase n=1 Tax=Rivibacter subsaxonicus TaxID=457575 RepID=A0A4Q7VMU2_9BURK|nr:polysaccharide pyruvyl transferase family protein [Rivibacter subsaxonicus]RZT97609.1 polysaccharide pyruvyl transferase [Rivibacter subsaxonicus]
MKRVGLIDNLQDIPTFIGTKFETASAAEVMKATGGNTGNVAFVHAARKILGNPITRIGWGWTPSVVRERVDHLVICCANQLGKHADLGSWADRLEQFDLPVTLLGLGAQSDTLNVAPEIPAGTVRFLQLVKRLNRSSETNIAVRGTFTQDVLLGHEVPSLAIGCPSLHISPVRDLGASIVATQQRREVQRVAVAAGNPWHGPSASLERVLVDIVDAYQGEYIIQHPESMLQFAFGEVDAISPQAKARFLEVYGQRFGFEELLEWYRRYAGIYVDPATWLRALRRFDLAIGPRYHGVALAIQAGRPGCVITIDSRTEELCLGTAVKHMRMTEAAGLGADELVARAAWSGDDAERFDQARLVKAVEYTHFLQANELQPSEHLQCNARLT